MQQLDLRRSDGESQAIAEDRRGQDERVDRRRPLERSPFDRRLETTEELGRALARDDFAIVKGRCAGDVVEMPMAQNDRELTRALALEERAERARMPD